MVVSSNGGQACRQHGLLQDLAGKALPDFGPGSLDAPDRGLKPLVGVGGIHRRVRADQVLCVERQEDGVRVELAKIRPPVAERLLVLADVGDMQVEAKPVANPRHPQGRCQVLGRGGGQYGQLHPGQGHAVLLRQGPDAPIQLHRLEEIKVEGCQPYKVRGTGRLAEGGAPVGRAR